MNGGSVPYEVYHFLKDCNKNSQIHISELVSGIGQHKIAENALF